MLEKCVSHWLSHLVPLLGRRAPPASRGTVPGLVVPGLTAVLPGAWDLYAGWEAQGEGQTALPRQVLLPDLGVPGWRWRRRASGPMGRRGLLLASDGPSSGGSPAGHGSGGVRLLPGHLPIVVLGLRKLWSLVTASVLWECTSPAAHVVPSVLGH